MLSIASAHVATAAKYRKHCTYTFNHKPKQQKVKAEITADFINSILVEEGSVHV